jgi:ZIP family zinc transporter
VIEAAAWGLVAASSLVLGAILAFAWDPSAQIRGLILAFGAGTLFGAVAYELIAEAIGLSLTGIDVAVGFAAGSLVFFLGSIALDRMAAQPAPASGGAPRTASARRARSRGRSVVLGAVLDGIPESIVLGISLIGTGAVGVPILVAIFVSNVPESLSASEDLEEGGASRTQVILGWAVVAVVSAIAAGLGYALLQDAPPSAIATIQAFAAGAILAMLAESMIPEASDIGGRAVGLATCVGFAVATGLSFNT